MKHILKRIVVHTAFSLSILSGLTVSSLSFSATNERPIIFYDGGWDNIKISNAIAIYIVRHGFGHAAEKVDSNVPKMQKAMEDGTIDVNMEMYNNLMTDWVNGATSKGDIVNLGEVYESASQGFYVPTYVIKGDKSRHIEPIAPQMRRIDDLARYIPAFRKHDPKGEFTFVNCIPGWACREINLIKLATYGVAKEIKSVEPATEDALNKTILEAYKAGRPFMTYYWSPSALPRMIDLTRIEEPAYSAACWADIDNLLIPFQPGVAAKSACAYETIPIWKYVTKRMATDNPDIVDFLRNMFIGTNNMSDLTAYMYTHSATPDDTAVHFLKDRTDLWKQWLPAAAQAKVLASLPR